MKFPLLFILIYLTVNLAFCQEKSFTLKAQNEYDKKHFAKAIEIYNRNSFFNFNSSKLLYNMGNFHYRNNSFAKSYYYFNEAKKLSPRDPDLKFNMNYVKKNFSHHIELTKPIYLFENFISFYEINLLLFSFLFLGLIFNLFINRNYSFKYLRNGSFFICIFIFVLFVSRYSNQQFKSAVILDQSASVYSGPSDKNVVLFNISKGNIVDILKQQNNWIKIKLDGNKRGWLNIKSIFFDKNI